MPGRFHRWAVPTPAGCAVGRFGVAAHALDLDRVFLPVQSDQQLHLGFAIGQHRQLVDVPDLGELLRLLMWLSIMACMLAQAPTPSTATNSSPRVSVRQSTALCHQPPLNTGSGRW